MFELNEITAITGESTLNTNLTTLDTEHCAKLLIAESINDMTRPIRRLSANARIASQQKVNREFALKIKNADGSTSDAIVELMKQAAMRVSAANQKGDEDAVREATQRLERVTNFLSDLASNVARNSFYRNEECLKMETPAADGKNETGVDGAIGAFATRSRYAGWKSVIVDSTVMTDAADEAINGLLAAIKSLLPFASTYLQSLFTNDKGQVHVQLGYQRLNEDETVQFYTRQDVWQNLEANRREVIEPLSVKDVVDAFKL